MSPLLIPALAALPEAFCRVQGGGAASEAEHPRCAVTLLSELQRPIPAIAALTEAICRSAADCKG